MKKYWKKIVPYFLVGILAIFLIVVASEHISFEALKENSARLSLFVKLHYAASLIIFAAAFVSTSLLVPGTVVLTISGGFLFGPLAGSFYSCLFSAAGSTLAFLLSRHLIGGWIQARYGDRLKRLNDEISRHGHNYLFALRVVPVMPAFLINYLAGVTTISTARFAVTTLCGMCPGAVLYSLAGTELHRIQSPKEILSPGALAGFLALAFFALIPVVLELVRHGFRRGRENSR